MLFTYKEEMIFQWEIRSNNNYSRDERLKQKSRNNFVNPFKEAKNRKNY
jgi:hypothetical protein